MTVPEQEFRHSEAPPSIGPARRNYAVDLDEFQGPLDLLLELIQHAELDITKIALARVTDQYINYLQQIDEHALMDISSFLVIAARLLQIKSEALLPRPPEREAGEEDPGDELARQLIAYRRYKQIAAYLGDRHSQGLQTFVRLAPPPVIDPILDLSSTTIDELRAAYETALRASPQADTLDRAVQSPRIRIRDQIKRILIALKISGRTTFGTVIEKTSGRLEIAISFLAVLELVKQRQIRADQAEPFGEIEIIPGSAWEADQEMDFDLEFEE